MKTIKLSILLLALLTLGQAKAQGLSGSGTTQDPYLITSDTDWTTFAQSVTDGTTYANKTVKLTANIAANVMAGSFTSDNDYHAFSGTFDGDGHAITLTLSGSGHGTALFCCIEGGILKNLKVQGSVTTTEYRPCTFVSVVFGNSTISNCWSTVAVSSTIANDWVDGGGFVGRVSSNAMLNMTDCAFHGSVTFDSTATTGGGMVGYTQSNATVNLTNCLYSPSALTLNVSQYDPRVFVSGQESGNINNCYYNAVAAASVLANQGYDTSGMTNEELVAALGPNWTITDGMVVPFSEQQYNISSAAEWDAFATALSNGISFSGRTVTLTADIPTAEEISNGTTAVTTMAGTNATPFAGIFDGQGHTLTVSIVSNAQSIAPFRFADGATFQNLKIDGNIDASNKFAAGMLAETKNHSCTFINCISNVTLTSSVSGDGTHGGFVAYLHKGNTTFEGCAFTGKLLGANTTHSGGFVGFTDSRSNASVTFTNCVFHPQQVTMSGTSSQTFARWYNNNSGSVTIGNNCYYSEAFGNAQGKQIHPITSGDYVTVAFDGNATPYELSGIDAYGVGIVYDSTLYAGNNETVSLNLSCTPPSGYSIIGYTATAGTLTGTANPYTLTMPNEAVTIQAVLGQPPVPYIDENGVEQQCTFYTVVTDTLDFYDLPAGWYVVNNDFTHNGPALFFGDAHLILCDGAMMNISYGGSGTAINTYGSLTLYGQSEGTGSLSATSNNGKGISVTNLMTINGSTVTASGGDSQGIYATNLTINGSTVTATGSSIGISSIDLTINGSTVTASANDDGGMGISANRVTINSGTVNATGNDSGINIGNEYGYVTINGGTVTVTGDYGIYSPTVTLGWSNTNDSITVGNFDYYDTPTVSVKSGQAFYYIDEDSGETVVISGTLNEDQINAIGGKTLFPYLPPVAYIDENGVEQECTSYSFVTEDLDFGNLPAGWYVVSNDITLNSNVYFTGDAHLILCDGATMNISVEAGDALDADGSLTLYGQSEGTGNLTATSTGYYDWFSDIYAPNLTINGGTVTATATDSESGIYTDNLTINGGTITATGGEYGIEAIYLTINGSTVTATGSSHGISSIDLTINGSTVTASANDDGGKGISANRVTINSGTVNATGNEWGIYIGNEYGYVTINGGTVTVTGDYGIYAPWVNLGWSNLNDSITVSSFAYVDTPTVKVKGGQAFYYEDNGETVIISGTLTAEEIEAISGKTLRPYIEPCATPFDLEVTDIGATTATLHWMGVQDSYNVRYRPANRSVEWFEATADTTTLDLTDLEPETEYEWEVQGIDCDGNGGTTEWSEWAFFTTEELTAVTQTTELSAGTNWFSTNLDITLDDLKAALVAASPGTTITIKSQNSGQTTWNGRLWVGTLRTMDVSQMYMISVANACEITLEGLPIDPVEHPVTISNGPNWIGFPLGATMTITNAFAGFASPGDIVKSDGGGQATWNGRIWTGQLKNLEPGKGYIYQSAATGNKTFTFPMGAK